MDVSFFILCSIAFLPLCYTLPLPLELSYLDGNWHITSLIIIIIIMHSFALSEWKKCVMRKQNKKDPPPPPPQELNGSSWQELDKQRSLQQWKTHCCTLPCSTFPHAGEPYKYISVSCASFTLALPKPFSPFCQGICTQLLVLFPLRNCSGQWFYLANLKHSW